MELNHLKEAKSHLYRSSKIYEAECQVGQWLAIQALAHAHIAQIERMDKLLARLNTIIDEDNGAIRIVSLR